MDAFGPKYRYHVLGPQCVQVFRDTDKNLELELVATFNSEEDAHAYIIAITTHSPDGGHVTGGCSTGAVG